MNWLKADTKRNNSTKSILALILRIILLTSAKRSICSRGLLGFNCCLSNYTKELRFCIIMSAKCENCWEICFFFPAGGKRTATGLQRVSRTFRVSGFPNAPRRVWSCSTVVSVSRSADTHWPYVVDIAQTYHRRQTLTPGGRSPTGDGRGQNKKAPTFLSEPFCEKWR